MNDRKCERCGETDREVHPHIGSDRRLCLACYWIVTRERRDAERVPAAPLPPLEGEDVPF